MREKASFPSNIGIDKSVRSCKTRVMCDGETAIVERKCLLEPADVWNALCSGVTDLADFYAKLREQRYRAEWHIPLLVPFAQTTGQTVLEIGTGNGADAVMFAMNGAMHTGIDLTETAVEHPSLAAT
jgi:2-polyprenyl-3-methyl-5-hydroxy-6-metoxy-1,4-benzoquinol methylase